MTPELPILGHVDVDGRLVQADAPLAALQAQAGAALGDPLALPQVAEIVRLASRLGVTVTREARVGSKGHDLDLWVRAVPGDGVDLAIVEWREVPLGAPRNPAPLPASGDRPNTGPSAAFGFRPDLSLTHLDPPFAGSGRLTRVFRLIEDARGDLPLLVALTARQPFAGQKAELRAEPGRAIILSGTPQFAEDGAFLGYEGRVQWSDGEADVSLNATLRTPIDRIIAAADQMVEGADGPLQADYAGYAEDIATAGRHLLSVIRSMSERVGGKSATVDLGAIVEEAAGLVQGRADAKAIDVDIADAGKDLRAIGEERAIRQIIVNILGNAIRHSPVGASVTIHFDRADGWLATRIADQGPGIAPDDQARIFEKFERAHEEDDGGTGLGLAISRRLARSMGGEISLDSELGKGACFTLKLRPA